MVINDYGKLMLLALIAVLGTCSGTALLISHSVSEAAGTGILTASITGPLSYIMGNGVLARRGEAPSPVLTTSPERLDLLGARTDERAAQAAAHGPQGDPLPDYSGWPTSEPQAPDERPFWPSRRPTRSDPRRGR